MGLYLIRKCVCMMTLTEEMFEAEACNAVCRFNNAYTQLQNFRQVEVPLWAELSGECWVWEPLGSSYRKSQRGNASSPPLALTATNSLLMPCRPWILMMSLEWEELAIRCVTRLLPLLFLLILLMYFITWAQVMLIDIPLPVHKAQITLKHND